ncbi:MAG: hypothetical protein AAGE59_33845 [Cyanobacteria bacterium P01_F01_bin.86]
MEAIQAVPSTPAAGVEVPLQRPNALTSEVMVFFLTIIVLVVFGVRR